MAFALARTLKFDMGQFKIRDTIFCILLQVEESRPRGFILIERIKQCSKKKLFLKLIEQSLREGISLTISKKCISKHRYVSQFLKPLIYNILTSHGYVNITMINLSCI